MVASSTHPDSRAAASFSSTGGSALGVGRIHPWPRRWTAGPGVARRGRGGGRASDAGGRSRRGGRQSADRDLRGGCGPAGRERREGRGQHLRLRRPNPDRLGILGPGERRTGGGQLPTVAAEGRPGGAGGGRPGGSRGLPADPPGVGGRSRGPGPGPGGRAPGGTAAGGAPGRRPARGGGRGGGGRARGGSGGRGRGGGGRLGPAGQPGGQIVGCPDAGVDSGRSGIARAARRRHAPAVPPTG